MMARALAGVLALLVAAPALGATPRTGAAGSGSGSGGTQLPVAAGTVAFDDSTLTQSITASDTWVALDPTSGGGVDWALQTDSTPCFDEPTDGQLRYICAADRAVEVIAQLALWPATFPAGYPIQTRIAKSTDGGSTFLAFHGAAMVSTIYSTADAEVATPSLIAGFTTLSQNDRLRVEIRSPATGGNSGTVIFTSARMRAYSAAGTPGLDADFASDGATNENVLTGRAAVSVKATSATLTSLEMSGGTIVNTGAVGAVTYTLGSGTCSAGQQFTVLNAEDGQTITVDPFSTDEIVNLTDAAGDKVLSDGAETSALTCQCIATGKWFCTRSGVWQDDN